MSPSASFSGLYEPSWCTTSAGGSGITDVVASETVVENPPIAGDQFEDEVGGPTLASRTAEAESWEGPIIFVCGRTRETSDRERWNCQCKVDK